MKDWFDGYVRHVAELKLDGIMSIDEGKSPLSVPGYKFLANKASKSTSDFSLAIFAWIFLLLCWNLIARCNRNLLLVIFHIPRMFRHYII